MQSNSQKGPAANRSAGGFGRSSGPGVHKTVLRTVILEDHPAIGAALEYLMLREGYAVELLGEGASATPGPALLLVGARDRSGLYVFKVRDAAVALGNLFEDDFLDLLEDPYARTEGIRAFVPIPFGSKDVLGVVRTVGEFETRESPGR